MPICQFEHVLLLLLFCDEELRIVAWASLVVWPFLFRLNVLLIVLFDAVVIDVTVVFVFGAVLVVVVATADDVAGDSVAVSCFCSCFCSG